LLCWCACCVGVLVVVFDCALICCVVVLC
jgi:hypothetical protein